MSTRATPLAVFLVLGLLVAACGDDDVPVGDNVAIQNDNGDEESTATVPDDDDGAVGEPNDADSQTDTPEPSEDDVVARSAKSRVIGPFGDRDLNVILSEDAACAIEDPSTAGGDAAAQVTGTSEDGTSFILDWSVDAGTLTSTLELDGTKWTVDADLDDTDDDPFIALTRNGEVRFETSYESEDGDTREARFYVNCQPVT